MKKIFTFLFLLLTNYIVFSQWSNDPAVNTAICNTTNQQLDPKIISDGNGGAVIAFTDHNNFTNDYNIHVQRVNASGVIQWALPGVVICNDPQFQGGPEIATDGNGGAIIIWLDYRLNSIGQIFAQRINGSGIVQWMNNGISLGNGTVNQDDFKIISDGSGGAFVTWKNGNLNNGPMRAQRINANGTIQWGVGGVSISTINDGGQYPQMIRDDAGGAILTWTQNYTDIYAQHINAAGVTQWAPEGTIICSAVNAQKLSKLTSNGSGGAIIAWQDRRDGFVEVTYAQHVNAGGAIQWGANGVPISLTSLNAYEINILSDGSGGAYLTWRYSSGGVVAQRINMAGTPQWTGNGVMIGGAYTSNPQIEPDGGTGAIIIFKSGSPADIYAQRINLAGTIQWLSGGVIISNAVSNKTNHQMVFNGNGGAIITWMDDRNNATSSIDIYTQQVNANGSLGAAVLPVTLLNFKANNINNDKVQLLWQTASEQNSHYFSIERSSDGIQFATIGKVNAAANSTSIKDYSFIDVSPGGRINYYRLRQVDTDGRFTYSPVIRISNNGSDLVFALFPNPAINDISITYAGKKEIVTTRIYDVQGRLVKQQTQRNELPIKVEVKQLEPGMYFIQLWDGKIIQKGRFIKQ